MGKTHIARKIGNLNIIEFAVKDGHVDAMQASSEREIVIRETPRFKPSIRHEVDAAMRQYRYRYTMPATLEWIERQGATAEYTEEVRIVNTGLILYRQPLRARRLTDEVYAICWKLAQPECQIVWAVLAQRYINMIAQIPWEQVEPV